MQADNQKAWVLRSDGSYERVKPAAAGKGIAALRSQEHFIALARRATLAEASRPPAVDALLATAEEPRPRKSR
jgi:hypothetical protein